MVPKIFLKYSNIHFHIHTSSRWFGCNGSKFERLRIRIVLRQELGLAFVLVTFQCNVRNNFGTNKYESNIWS